MIRPTFSHYIKADRQTRWRGVTAANVVSGMAGKEGAMEGEKDGCRAAVMGVKGHHAD